jgi:hypothetical protein
VSEIDYMDTEKRAYITSRLNETDEFIRGLSVGWNAALTAAHAKAKAGRCVECNGTGAIERDGIDRGCPMCRQAKADEGKAGEHTSEVPRFVAYPEGRIYWAWRGSYSEWVFPPGVQGDPGSELDLGYWKHYRKDAGYIPCTTEAEARAVAGFPADEGEDQPKHAEVQFRTVGMGRATGDGKIEMVKFWASAGLKGYYSVHKHNTLFYDVDGSVCEVSLGYMAESVQTWNATPCTTEAEARRVAGFPEEEKAQ